MDISNRREPLVLFAGDIVIFFFSLWLTLFLRYGEMPKSDVWDAHLAPFLFLFVLWVAVFFIAGLYEKHTLFLKSRLPQTILKAQITNSALAVAFFYFISGFSVAPKTNLFLYLIVSFFLILLWRFYFVPNFGFRTRQKAILIGSGSEMKELLEEVNGNNRYNIEFVSSVDLDEVEHFDFEKEVMSFIYSENITSLVVDLRNPKVESLLPKLYNLIFSKVKFIDMYRLYEEIFDRVPLSLLTHSWFLENLSSPHRGYIIFKRIVDIVLSVVIGLLFIVLFPLIAILIKLDDGGPLFTTHNRVGQHNRLFRVFKLRTLERIEEGVWHGETKNLPTRIGHILRVLSIDEFPQVLNVFKGELSLIGPRSDLASLEPRLREALPYYSIRYLVPPGISGWAQVNQQYAPGHINPQTIEENKIRLMYDLYYVKNRSILLDIKIALRTVKTLLSRVGK